MDYIGPTAKYLISKMGNYSFETRRDNCDLASKFPN